MAWMARADTLSAYKLAFQNDDTYDQAQAHHTKPCNAMPTMPGLRLVRRGERACTCGERCHIQTLLDIR